MAIIKDKKEVRKMLNAISNFLETKGDSITYKPKLINVGTATWTNALTKKPQKVEDIYLLGYVSSDRPLVINKVYVSPSFGEKQQYIINNRFSHVNMSSFQECKVFKVQGDGVLFPTECFIEFYGQYLCSPLTALHLLETDKKDIQILLRGILNSQNFDDAYFEYNSVSNKDIDLAIETPIGSLLTLTNASPIELILGETGSSLTSMNTFDLDKRLRDLISIKKDEVWAKKKDEEHYKILKKASLRRSKELYSDYYPVFDYKAIQNMKIKIPKDKYDLGVYGLGSAGTAILDQVCRSNWIKSIYMCDFDKVEAKNMINQWYDKFDIGSSKTIASSNSIKGLSRPDKGVIPTNFYITHDTDLFQNTDLESKSFKYVISGFDSIKARMEFLNAILDGKIEAKYLIDCRYLDLACSIYMIDLENTEELEFYKANLEADAELIKTRNEKEKLTKEEFKDWFNRKGYFFSSCAFARKQILNESGWDFECVPRHTSRCDCACEECVDYLYKLYLESCPNSKVSRTDASCVKYNYIDIYKYVGAIVFGAFRNIENNNEKPFALVEAETDVKGLPSCMVVRR